MIKPTFFIDSSFKKQTIVPFKVSLLENRKVFKNLEFLCRENSFTAYVERNGLFSFSGRKIDESKSISNLLVDSGIHKFVIPKGTNSEMIAFYLKSLFFQTKVPKCLPNAYKQTINVVNIVEDSSHLIPEELYNKLLANLSFKGNEIVMKVSAIALASAGTFFLMHTFPINSALLRFYSLSYIVAGTLIWQNSKPNVEEYMDILQSVTRPNFDYNDKSAIRLVNFVVNQITDKDLKSDYINFLKSKNFRFTPQILSIETKA